MFKLTHAKEKAQLSSVVKIALDKLMVEAIATNVVAPKDD